MIWVKYIGIFILFLTLAFVGMILLAPSEVTVQVNEDIKAPVNVVFESHSNYSHFSKWINGVKSAKQTKGDGISVGSEYEVLFEDDKVLIHTPTLIENNKRYAYTAEVADFFNLSSNTIFEALDTNSTRVMTKLSLSPSSWKMKMFMYFEKTHRQNAANNLTSLKNYLEQN